MTGLFSAASSTTSSLLASMGLSLFLADAQLERSVVHKTETHELHTADKTTLGVAIVDYIADIRNHLLCGLVLDCTENKILAGTSFRSGRGRSSNILEACDGANLVIMLERG